jgi:hypothetical protein
LTFCAFSALSIELSNPTIFSPPVNLLAQSWIEFLMHHLNIFSL